MERALGRFDVMDTISFFRGIGLLVKDKNGYLYPSCEQAAVVLDVLRYEMKALHIKLHENRKVTAVHKKKDKWMVDASGEHFTFDSVVIACGGKAAPKTGSDGSGFKLARELGHRVTKVVPALVQLICKEEYLKAVAGVRADAEISVFSEGKCVAKERGELQLTDYGVSGIPVFQLSRMVNFLLADKKEVELSVNLLPDFNEGEFTQLCQIRRLLQEGRTTEEFLTGLLHKKLIMLFMKQVGLKSELPVSQIDEAKLEGFYNMCQNWRLHVTGSKSFDNAQVSAGGVELSQITDNMESLLLKDLYFAGEILDVDGKCGGYNLQWAWSSGYLSGMAAAGTPVVKE
ncbi:MAG: aminoacetone oxidase family FAD-binding enzyme [Lachnospiraceae bacterium]|nr:aminoacetone oxidase family FAD-binding enzyme [Lachnospiraceae bacterium]